MAYVPAPTRYDQMAYRRSGRSGLQLPEISLGLWQNFGETTSDDRQRAIVQRAFDLGVTHFDLANNYGPPPGAAETNFGRILATDLRSHRDELVISSKAGYDMWPGPYGNWGSRKYLLASLDQSLVRMGLDYVDIFYSHRVDPMTPLEETMGALDAAVRQGKALYAGVSSYSAERTVQAASILRHLGTPLLISQPSYSMLNRWIEGGLLEALGNEGVGCIVFSPLAQGLLTGKYLDGIPAGSRASARGSFSSDLLDPSTLERVRGLAAIAARRGQSLAQMALAWSLRDQRVTSALVGAGSVAQLDENLGSLRNQAFSAEELAEIDVYAQESGINLWLASSVA
ncbi:MAG: L-glyceraldehyde 3-phosphate reductase [Chloroflexi bacterium]|nr:L-glyceraldehyde 3-phosphate reductase [Chloroflexota bacterium]